MDALQLLHFKGICYLTKYDLSDFKGIIKTKSFAFRTVLTLRLMQTRTMTPGCSISSSLLSKAC